MAPQKLFQSCSSHSLALLLSLMPTLSLLFSLFCLFVQKWPSCFLLLLSAKEKKKHVCVNRFQVMFKAPFFPFSPLPSLPQVQTGRLLRVTPPLIGLCVYSQSAHTRALHKNMHMLSMHLQTPPLCLSGGELCHLFKCSLIVWPWGLGGRTHKL